ncbi:MAG: prephenate dehydrogenase [Oscillospiraceae bacterium]|nr:prephenate dehydrogenase [Oscillospiraceae bacterium]
MTVGIVGLGLIGGSFAKAYSAAGARVLAYNRSRSVLDFAIMNGDVAAELTAENIAECELILIALYPEAVVEYFEKMAPYISKDTLVMDCGGTKRNVCTACFAIAAAHGLTFCGDHPMAGTHNSGYKYARANLYHGAPMVIVPPDFDDLLLMERAERLLAPVGFGKFTFTTAAEHDEMIAFTSQMAHIVSNGYIKSPTARKHKGFSAGSYKDLTRVAWLNPEMWAELFLENRDNLIKELDSFVGSMEQYRAALVSGDREELVKILDEGRRIKEEVDGR